MWLEDPGCSLSLCGMRVQGLVTLWGLGLFNEVVICLHRGSPLNPKFTVSSDSVYKLLSVSNKNGFYSCLRTACLISWCISAGSTVLSPPCGYHLWVCICLTRCWHRNLCLWLYCAEGQMQIVSQRAAGRKVHAGQRRLCSAWLGVFVQPFSKGAEDCPAVPLQFAPGPSEKQHQHLSYREGTENTIHSAVCLKC